MYRWVDIELCQDSSHSLVDLYVFWPVHLRHISKVSFLKRVDEVSNIFEFSWVQEGQRIASLSHIPLIEVVSNAVISELGFEVFDEVNL